MTIAVDMGRKATKTNKQNKGLPAYNNDTVKKPALSDHLIIYKTKVLMENSSLMEVKVLQNALLEHSAILLTCIK